MMWDKNAEPPYCRCEVCGGEIYRGERIYSVGAMESVCCACVRESIAGEFDEPADDSEDDPEPDRKEKE